MQKNIISMLWLLFVGMIANAQPNIRPATEQMYHVYIIGPTLHLGNGQIIENGFMSFNQGKITAVGPMGEMRPDESAVLINAAGRHIYPGLIAPMTTIGLSEIEAVRATRDFAETGDLNPHVRAVIAYNADSKVIPTVRSNGILLAQVAPEGGLIAGQSSVMQLDGWNWEDALLKSDVAVHLNWPCSRLINITNASAIENYKQTHSNQLQQLQSFFVAAQSYSVATPTSFNARLQAMKGVFAGTKKLFIHAEYSSDIIQAVKFCKRFNITPVIVGASEAHLIAEFLKENQISVILNQPHTLPNLAEEDIDLPYKQAKLLQDAGVLFSFAIDGFWQQRNLPFVAGTTVAYGLTKEQALAAITLNAAKIMGVDAIVGSLETGKDATFLISKGDILDIITNDVERAFIKGKDLNLDNLHKQLYKRYAEKYGIVAK